MISYMFFKTTLGNIFETAGYHHYAQTTHFDVEGRYLMGVMGNIYSDEFEIKLQSFGPIVANKFVSREITNLKKTIKTLPSSENAITTR